MLVKAGGALGMAPHNDAEHSKLLNNDIKWAALTKVITPLLLVIFIAMALFLWVRRKRKLRREQG